MNRNRKILASLGLLAVLAFSAYLYRVPLALAASPVELWFNGAVATTANPYPVTCISGCSGGGGSSVTIAGPFGATTASGGLPIAFPTDQSLAITGTVTANTSQVFDACQLNAKTTVPISQTANAKVISAASAKKNYICSIAFNGSDAENISIVEGTGTVCASSPAAILGGTTAAAGMNFAAGGGVSIGAGTGVVMNSVGTNVDVCIYQSGSGRVSGVLTYVQQ